MKYEKSKNSKSNDISSKKSSNRKVKGVLLLSVLLTGFVIVGTNSFMRVTPQILDFKTNLDVNQARTGKNITFSLEFLGNPSKIALIYGDGNVESIEDTTNVGTSHNAIYSANFTHVYQLQGKYTPKILVYYYDFIHVREVTREVNLLIQNDAPQFDVLIESNGLSYDILNISESREIFEGDEMNINITNLEEDFTLNNILFEFPDSQISTRELSITKSFDISGKYPISQFPISISVIGSCGELTRKTFHINVRNKVPEAYFELIKASFDVGEIVEVSTEKCVDTTNDLDSLFYYVEWAMVRCLTEKIASTPIQNRASILLLYM